MGVCVCVNVLCGIVRKEVFSPRERKIFFIEIREGKFE